MINPFKNVPFNRKQSFVMGLSKEGTEIYLPVDSNDDDVLAGKRKELQEFLTGKPTDNPAPEADFPARA